MQTTFLFNIFSITVINFSQRKRVFYVFAAPRFSKLLIVARPVLNDIYSDDHYAEINLRAFRLREGGCVACIFLDLIVHLFVCWQRYSKSCGCFFVNFWMAYDVWTLDKGPDSEHLMCCSVNSICRNF